MSWSNISTILLKDLRLGPRSPVFLWALVMPILITLLVRGVFGGLFEPEPRLGIVDLGNSQMVDQALELAEIEVSLGSDPEDLRTRVEENNLDAGLIIPAGWDQQVQTGQAPLLDLFVGGESLAANRIILAVTALDLTRQLSGEPLSVEVDVISVGEEQLDLEARLLPLIVIYAVAIGGGFVPGAGLVEEREKGTLTALLVSPVRVGEVLLAKGLLGIILSLLTGFMVLALNVGWGPHPEVLVLGVVLGAVMMSGFGILLGVGAKNSNTFFTAWKSVGILLFFPVIFPIWPDLPQWIARLGPTFYFLNPIFRVSTDRVGLAVVWPELLVGFAICLFLVPTVLWSGGWLERRLVAGRHNPVVTAMKEEERKS